MQVLASTGGGPSVKNIKQHSLGPVLWCVAIATLGAFSFGYHASIVNGPLGAIAKDLGFAGDAAKAGLVIFIAHCRLRWSPCSLPHDGSAKDMDIRIYLQRHHQRNVIFEEQNRFRQDLLAPGWLQCNLPTPLWHTAGNRVAIHADQSARIGPAYPASMLSSVQNPLLRLCRKDNRAHRLCHIN